MKKIMSLLLIICACLLITGCGCMKKTARGSVEDFLDQYKNLSASVLEDMDDVIDQEADLSEDQKDKYRDILKKQYTDLEYEILDENYDGNKATVEAKIVVYDLYKVQENATTYLTDHVEEFNDENGNYDNSKFIDYKLEKMQKNSDTVEYTIEFNLTKDESDNWQINELSKSDLEKIHGIYNYDNE